MPIPAELAPISPELEALFAAEAPLEARVAGSLRAEPSRGRALAQPVGGAAACALEICKLIVREAAEVVDLVRLAARLEHPGHHRRGDGLRALAAETESLAGVRALRLARLALAVHGELEEAHGGLLVPRAHAGLGRGAHARRNLARVAELLLPRGRVGEALHRHRLRLERGVGGRHVVRRVVEKVGRPASRLGPQPFEGGQRPPRAMCGAQVLHQQVEQLQVRALHLVDHLVDRLGRARRDAQPCLHDQHRAVDARLENLDGSERREEHFLFGLELRERAHVSATRDNPHLGLDDNLRVARRPAGRHVVHGHLSVGRAAHEARLDAATEAVVEVVRGEEVGRQRATQPAVDPLGARQLGESRHTRVDHVEGRGV